MALKFKNAPENNNNVVYEYQPFKGGLPAMPIGTPVGMPTYS